MDHNLAGDGDFDIEIGSCSYTNEVEAPEALSQERLGTNFFAEVFGLADSENRANGCEGSPDNVGRTRNEKRKSTAAKKPPKPPRPPRGYSLDGADQRLIKEIAELAMLKRARVERMKAVKKMKEAKASVSNSRWRFFAMFFSVVFFLVIVFHGSYSSSSSTSQFHGSPEAAGAVENFIMNQYRKSFSTNGIYSTTPESEKLVEEIFARDPGIMLPKASE